MLDRNDKQWLCEMMDQRLEAQEHRINAGMDVKFEALRAEMKAGDAALRAEFLASNNALRRELNAVMDEGKKAFS